MERKHHHSLAPQSYLLPLGQARESGDSTTPASSQEKVQQLWIRVYSVPTGTAAQSFLSQDAGLKLRRRGMRKQVLVQLVQAE